MTENDITPNVIDSAPDSLRGRHMVVITQRYPYPGRPFDGVFVQQLIHVLVRMGLRCSVIHPQAVKSFGRRPLPARIEYTECPGAQPIKIIRPRMLSFSNKQLGAFNTFRLTHWSFCRAVRRALGQLEQPADLFYGHFLTPAGATAVTLARVLGVPSFIAVGESSFSGPENYGLSRSIRTFRDVSAMIANSSRNRRLLTELLRVPAKKVAMFPNGGDLSRFYPRDRAAMRRKFNLPKDEFLVAFVGAFIERKGALRVAEAIEGIENVGGLYVGDGASRPEGDQVRFCGRLPHDEVPELLSAADVFMLPTLNEGSCNAIVEAMACGLPIITSDGEFNDDLVDNTTAIRVNPQDVPALRQAVMTLIDDVDRRHRMATAAREIAETRDINNRAKRVCEWIAQHM